MKHYAVIGDPIEHSLSPMIYGELFSLFNVSADFDKIRLSSNEIADIRTIMHNYSGFAITMPHKRSIIPLLDALSPSAIECGAVNIVERKGALLIGHNTDGLGIVDALTDEGICIEGSRVFILGRGGAALAAAHTLKKHGAFVTLIVQNRNFRHDISLYSGIGVSEIDGISREILKCDIFINATPLGMSGYKDFDLFSLIDSFEPSFILDMVYLSKNDTRLIAESKKRGIRGICGGAMLYNQALHAFSIWTGIPVDNIKKVVKSIRTHSKDVLGLA